MIKALISSMTPKERENPDLLNNSRKREIGEGGWSFTRWRLTRDYYNQFRMLGNDGNSLWKKGLSRCRIMRQMQV